MWKMLCVAAWVWTPVVLANDAREVSQRFTEVLREMRIEGVKVFASNRIVFVEGAVSVPGYKERVAQLVKAFQLETPTLVFQSMVKVDPQVWVRLAERVEREIGSPEVTVRVVAKSVMLEGTVESDFEADRSLTVAKVYFRPEAHDRVVAGEGASTFERFEIIDLLRVRRLKPTVAKRK